MGQAVAINAGPTMSPTPDNIVVSDDQPWTWPARKSSGVTFCIQNGMTSYGETQSGTSAHGFADAWVLGLFVDTVRTDETPRRCGLPRRGRATMAACIEARRQPIVLRRADAPIDRPYAQQPVHCRTKERCEVGHSLPEATK